MRQIFLIAGLLFAFTLMYAGLSRLGFPYVAAPK